MFEVFIILLIAAVIVTYQSIKIVPQQNAWVVERLGKYHATLGPGLNIVIPFIDRIAYRHRMTEFPLDIQPQVCITQDNTQVTIDGILYFQITDAKQASYGTSNYLAAISQLAQTTLRSECGKRTLDKMLEERATINTAVVSALDMAGTGWGVKVLRYEIKDVTPPAAVLAAMQKQLTAEREKRALIMKSEGEMQQEINIAEGAKKAAIAQSEGQMKAAINKAEGEAQAITLVAEATAGAIEKVAAASKADGGIAAINLKVAEQYIKAFANLAKEGTTILLPANVGDAAGMVATAMSVMQGISKSK